MLRLVGALRIGVRTELEELEGAVLRGMLMLRDLLLEGDGVEGVLLVMLRLVGALCIGVRTELEEFEGAVLRDLLLGEDVAELRGVSLTDPLPEEMLRLGGALL